MRVVTKVLMKVLADRATKLVSPLLTKWQGGFKEGEETIAQVVALLDILHRRNKYDLTTVVLFLDFRKAYDTVPHEALFAKLRRFGMPKRFIDLMVAYYKVSKTCVKVGSGLSGFVNLRKGVRQG